MKQARSAAAQERGAYSAVVEGRVQGVGFRYHALEEAERRGLCGWVRNTSAGAVEVWAEGPEEELRQFLRWLEKGPPWARVDAVRVSRQVPSGAYQSFRITSE